MDRLSDLPSDLPEDLASDLRSDQPPSNIGEPQPRRSATSDLRHDLRHDLGGDLDADDEVWFEAEALAAASEIAFDRSTRGSPLRAAPGLAQLLAAISEPGISLAALPGWPSSGPAGHGLGAALAELVGELRPGDLVVLTGGARGVGRSSLLAQLSDGLALRRNLDQPQTPVLCMVDAAPELWRARSLARWSGLDARVFVDAGHARRAAQLDEQIKRFDDSVGPELQLRQRFADARSLDDTERRRELLAALRRWRVELARTQPDNVLVWPVLVIDPLEQLERDVSDVLADLAQLAVDEGVIVLASCDDPPPTPADTRRFDRHVCVRLRAEAVADDGLALHLCHRRLGPTGRVQLRWDRATGRIEID